MLGPVVAALEAEETMRRLTSALLWFWAACAIAAPVQFSSTQFLTDAVAVAEGSADADSATSPPSSLPLISSATVVGTFDVALSGAIAATGLLGTSAEASSQSDVATAVAVAGFLGTFLAPDAITLIFDFATTHFTDPAAFSDGQVAYSVVSGALSYAGTLDANGVHQIPLLLTAGMTSSIDILVTSEASTSVGGSAFNASTLTFRVEDVSRVPEPALPSLLVAALMAFGAPRVLRARRVP
jgi:hypothetical protein